MADQDFYLQVEKEIASVTSNGRAKKSMKNTYL
jgi:hypothetical protein